MDVTLTNASLADGTSVDVEITDGFISAVNDAATTSSRGERHDLRGWLLMPSMGEPHAHLDKALTADLVPNPAGDLRGAIDSWIENSHRITPDETHVRARAALDRLIAHGVTAVRSHVNCGEFTGTTSMKILAEIRDEYADLVDLELVALSSNPMLGRDGEGNRRSLIAAVEAGADLVGGCPALEDDDGPGVINLAIDIASDAGLRIDLHVDETLDASTLTLRDLAHIVQDRGFEHSVTASHCVSLGMQALETQHEVSRQVAAAGINVVALPQTNLFLQGHQSPTAMPRGLTAVGALLAAGANVTAGADNVQDPFNLVGRSDPLETAALMVMAGHVQPDDAFAMVSSAVRSTLGHDPVSVSVGDAADLVAIDAPSVREAIADAPMSRRVYRRGRLISSSDVASTIHR